MPSLSFILSRRESSLLQTSKRGQVKLWLTYFVALHHAVANGHREITALLCELDYSQIEAIDINGCTPVFSASRYNEAECLKLLISHDANLFHAM